MFDKLYVFVLIVSIVWVGAHLYREISVYSKEYGILEGYNKKEKL